MRRVLAALMMALTGLCALLFFVAITSYAMTGDREKALEAGCTGYIEKPINPDTFVAQVESHLPGCIREGGGE